MLGIVNVANTTWPPGAKEADLPVHIERLVATITPRRVASDRFAIDVSDYVHGHLFGGLVAAQALHVAYSSVGPHRLAQSAHAYFLRRGIPRFPSSSKSIATLTGDPFLPAESSQPRKVGPFLR